MRKFRAAFLLLVIALVFVHGLAQAQTLPSLNNGDIWVGNGSNVATAVTPSGDCTFSNSGSITCTQTNGINFGPLATAITVGTSYLPTGSSSSPGILQCGSGTTCAGGVISASGSVSTGTAGQTAYYNANGAAISGITDNALSFGGFVNKFRNGTFDAWQRGTSGLSAGSSGSYTADGWIVTATGANDTCAQATGTSGTLFALKCSGATSNTDTKFSQRIESYVAAPLAGNTVTVQYQYQQNSGSSVAPKVSACYASATDNFTTCTSDLAPTSLTSCASGSWCTESYSFFVSSNASNGYQVTLDCNTALTSSQACQITAADIRVTPGVSSGINASPPPPELRPLGAEMPFNYRYYYAVSGVSLYGLIGNTNDTARHLNITWPVVMRAAPTFSPTWSAGTNTTTSLTSYGVSFYSFLNNTTSVANCTAFTASAEL